MFTEVLLGITLLFILYFLNKKPKNLPPGLWGLPIIGSLPRRDLHLADQAIEHSKKFGDIFSWRIGSRLYIYLCSYDIIKNALKRPEFSGRPKIFFSGIATNFVNAGVLVSNGKLWQSNRRFGLFHLKNLGLGKSSYEAVIQDEVMYLLKDFESCVGKDPLPISYSLNVANLNVIWRICADRRYNVDDEELQYFVSLIYGLTTNVPFIVNLYDDIPWLHEIVPGFLNSWFGINDFIAIYTKLGGFMQETIDDHKKKLDPENPRDFIDQYLIEMYNQKDNPNSTMNELDLRRFVFDLFLAGSETSSSTIRWAIFCLATHQDIQRKVQEELDSVVDRNTLPSMKDRERLPYFEAVIREVQRFVSLAPLGLNHMATEDTTLKGYSIPKGAILIPCLSQCLSDPSLWKRPNEFYPEHFLDDEGKLIKDKKGFVPFSTGKRVCLGESLAIMELFLFLTAIFQKFTFVLPEGEELDPKMHPKSRFINACKAFKVIIKKRC